MERRRIRGRDGGPGPCSGRGPGDRGRQGCQGGAGRAGGQGGAGGTNQRGSDITGTPADSQGGAGNLAGSKGRAEDHLSGADKAEDLPSGSGRTAKRSRERLVTALMATKGQADCSATVFLSVTGQTESSGMGATAQRGAEADTAASGGSAAEAATSGGTGAG